MEIKRELIKREIAGDIMLVPVGKTVLDYTGLFALNEQGGFIWDLLPRVSDSEEIVAALMEEYEVDEATLRQDVSDFLDELRKMGIIG